MTHDDRTRAAMRPRPGAYYARIDGRLPVGRFDHTRAHWAKRASRIRRQWRRER